MREIYCKYGLEIAAETVINDLYKDYKKNKDPSKAINLLSQMFDWIQEDHENVSMKINRKADYFRAKKPNYLRQIMGNCRIYLRARTGIKISSEDLLDKISFPVDEIDKEDYPLTIDQFQKIYDNTTIGIRKVKYLFMRDTGCRNIESCRVNKTMITFDYDKSGIVKVELPKRIVKGKVKARRNFLTKETGIAVRELCQNLDETALIFDSHPERNRTEDNFISAEKGAFIYERERLKSKIPIFAEKHETGTHKIVLHSIRAFTATAYAAANGESAGHGYIGHKKYLEQYIRRSEAEQLQMFKNAIPLLTGIVKEYDDSELAQEVKEGKSQIALLARQIAELKKTGQKVVQAKSDQSAKWKFVIDELLKLEIVSQTDILEILERAPKVVIPKE